MPEAPQVKKGPADTPPGQGQQLQQGEAQAANEAAGQFPIFPHDDPMLQEPAPRKGPPPPPEGVQLVKPGDGDGTDSEGPLDEDQQILYGDSTGAPLDAKQMLLQSNARIHSESIPVPTKLLRSLPYLRQMAEDPHAPRSVQAFYRAVLLGIEERLRNSGRQA